MTKEEYYKEYTRLKEEIERNERIHCKLVAARYRRELERLIEKWNEQMGVFEDDE